jgi:hypothetical protein
MDKSITRRRFAATAGLSIAMGLVGAGCVSTALAQSVKRLPPVTAYDLSGQERRFPSGLPAELTILIVAFERAQQSVADRMLELYNDGGPFGRGIAMIETPVIQDPGSAGRFFIDNSMKAGIRDAEKRKVVVTLYVPDLDAWLAETGLGSKNSVYLMAVNRSGRVLKTARADSVGSAESMKNFIAQSQRTTRN